MPTLAVALVVRCRIARDQGFGTLAVVQALAACAGHSEPDVQPRRSCIRRRTGKRAGQHPGPVNDRPGRRLQHRGAREDRGDLVVAEASGNGGPRVLEWARRRREQKPFRLLPARVKANFTSIGCLFSVEGKKRTGSSGNVAVVTHLAL